MRITTLRHLCGSAAFCVCLSVSTLSSTVQAQNQLGWPRSAGSSNDNHGSPLLADLDGDGRSELLLVREDDKLYVHRHDGTTFTTTQAFPPLGFGHGTRSAIAVGNVDFDAQPEIVIVGNNATFTGAVVKVFDVSGALLQSVPLSSTASGKATPCLIDCVRYVGTTRHDADEIVIRDGDGKVHILYWTTSGFQNKYSDAQFQTCTSDTEMDRFGSQFITPSVSAAWDEAAGTTLLVAASTNGKIYRWQIESSATSNWLVNALTPLTDGTTDTQFSSSPALVNLDNDPELEIVAAGSKKQVWAWNNDSAGSVLAGWPQTIGKSTASSPAVADIDLLADGAKEVIIASDDHKVWVWRANGTVLPGWPKQFGGPAIGSAVAGEIDGFPGLEIVMGGFDGYLYAWNHEGNALDGWPKRLSTQIFGSAALGDIHNGGRMSVVASGSDGRLFVFDLSPKSLDTQAGWLQFRGGQTRIGAE